jgi:hypothetical protein
MAVGSCPRRELAPDEYRYGGCDGGKGVGRVRKTAFPWKIVLTSSGAWNLLPCIGRVFQRRDEVPMLGDFNNDGRADVITFTQGDDADVWVSLSDGTVFAGIGLFHDFFSVSGEIPLVGDFNGDGKDDLVSLDKGAAEAWVTLSTGSSFGGSFPWSNSISPGDQLPLVGDFDGDGFSDIASFTRGGTGDVFVSISTGSSFKAAVKWHDSFAFGDEVPRVSDVNGDGLDDIITFVRTSGAVFVALSNGTSFVGNGSLWHSGFAFGSEIPLVGDVNADGFGDLVLFQQATGEVRLSRAVP